MSPLLRAVARNTSNKLGSSTAAPVELIPIRVRSEPAMRFLRNGQILLVITMGSRSWRGARAAEGGPGRRGATDPSTAIRARGAGRRGAAAGTPILQLRYDGGLGSADSRFPAHRNAPEDHRQRGGAGLHRARRVHAAAQRDHRTIGSSPFLHELFQGRRRDDSSRPLMFLGGAPGVAAAWQEFGGLGPKRMKWAGDDAAGCRPTGGPTIPTRCSGRRTWCS